MKRYRSLALAAGAALCLALGPALSVLAHPLGNFTVNQYSRIELSREQLTLRYIVDMAEIPTFQESALIDLNHDGQLDASEGAAYLKTKAEQLRQGLVLQVDGQPRTLAITSEAISFAAGQGGLPTTRMVIDLAAPAASGSHSLLYHDDNYSDRLGWREIIVRGAGVALAQSSVPALDRSAELTAYPEDMLTSPLDVREARATFETASASPLSGPGAPAGAAQPVPGAPQANILDRSRDDLAALIATQELSLPVVLLALLAAAGLGALHSLSPGHGKTVVGAYLVGSRGTARHALFLGLTVTLTHTAGVFALGLVTLFASQFILPEQLYPWLSLLSGLFVALIGISLFVTRLRSYLRARAAERSGRHGVTRPAEHPAAEGGTRSAVRPAAAGKLLPAIRSLWTRAPALALAAAHPAQLGDTTLAKPALGIAPASASSNGHDRVDSHAARGAHALDADPRHPDSHDHAHPDSLLHAHAAVDCEHTAGYVHAHDAGDEAHPDSHDHVHTAGYVHAASHVHAADGTTHAAAGDHAHDSHGHAEARHAAGDHAHDSGHMHSHAGGRPHSHLPLDAQGNVTDRISWRNLLALGISGGLLPCPSALVVLLAAISLHRVAFGLLLIVAFSAGLAGVLTAIGLLLVYAGRQFERVRAPGALVRLLPAGSALVVTALGLVILVEALGQVGLIR